MINYIKLLIILGDKVVISKSEVIYLLKVCFFFEKNVNYELKKEFYDYEINYYSFYYFSFMSNFSKKY